MWTPTWLLFQYIRWGWCEQIEANTYQIPTNIIRLDNYGRWGYVQKNESQIEKIDKNSERIDKLLDIVASQQKTIEELTKKVGNAVTLRAATAGA